jgi:hypothetical protein
MSSARPLVYAAFPEVPFPDMTLQEAELADSTLDREIPDEEWQAAQKAGKGVAWSQVPLEVLLDCPAALSHISETGFVYFAPAYICAALDHLKEPKPQTEELVGSTVFHLTHTETNYSLSRLKLFSAEQRSAIVAFLSEVAAAGGFTGNEARVGLESYWLTPKASEALIYVP